jgi:predicted ester cyclase
MSNELNQANKLMIWDFWQTLEGAAASEIEAVARSMMNADLAWYGPDPVNVLSGVNAFVADFWLPLQQSFPDLKRQIHLFFGGKSNGRIDGDISLDGKMWVGGTGYFNGTFARDYLTIPATHGEVSIRWGEFCRLERGKIVEIYFLLDLVDLMQQAGYQVLPSSRGKDNLYPPPRANDGILLEPHDEQESKYSLDHIRRFIFEGLNKYDQSELKSMGMADFFHPDMQWYGPGGIGACLSLKEFEALHQQPWLHAFPDRAVQNLDALFAEGSYSGAPGWSGVKATHTGQYLDCPATGKHIEINGLDWWKRDGEIYVENWVFVDMIHLFRQFDIDLFERLARQINRPRI